MVLGLVFSLYPFLFFSFSNYFLLPFRQVGLSSNLIFPLSFSNLGFSLSKYVLLFSQNAP
jgi:hypothetical protein